MSADVKAWPRSDGRWSYTADDIDFFATASDLFTLLEKYHDLTTWVLKMDSNGKVYLDGRP